MSEYTKADSGRSDEKMQSYFAILKDIVRIDSPSRNEMDLADHICSRYMNGRWQGERDDMGNIYVTPADHAWDERLPLLNAHIDTRPVDIDPEDNKRHWTTPKEQAEILKNPDFLCLQDGRVLKSKLIQAGFDDKAGVAMILYLMHHTDLRFRAIFTVQEEWAGGSWVPYGRQGGAGIEEALTKRPEFFNSASWTIMVDREGGRDIICEYGDASNYRDRLKTSLCSKEFLDRLERTSAAVGYPMRRAEGRIGDAYNIRRKFRDLDVVNLSCGYYNDHHPEEDLKIDEALNVMGVVEACIRETSVRSPCD